MPIPKHIRFIFFTYLWGILFFSLFRIVLFATQWSSYLQLPDERLSLIARAFFMGWRFDTAISGYLLALPLLVLTVAALFPFQKRFLYNSITWFIGIIYSLAFVMCVADIPHYDHFYSRLNSMIFQWLHALDFGFSMIAEEPVHYLYFGIFVLICWLFFKVIFRLKKRILDQPEEISGKSAPLSPPLPPSKGGVLYPPLEGAKGVDIKLWWLLLSSLIFMGLTFLGIRGRIDEKSPIRVGTAAFSNHALPNHLGLNPVFTLMKSTLNDLKPENQTIRFMEDEEAIRLCREYLHVPDSTDFVSPIARRFEAKGEALDANVVLVLLESMSTAKMGRYGNPYGLTPNLDSLAEQGISFDRFYTAGIHTHNGLHSTLCSYPALMKKHSMSVVNIPQYAGIANVLKSQEYSTVHFMTHDAQFDNAGGFLSTNGYERVVSEDDYPQAQVKSTLGVPDHIMYEFSIDVLNELHESGQPFFASYMTTSDHIPYVIPDDIPFTPKQASKDLAIVEYVDWSVQHFLELCRQEDWFENTLFVFLADHGRAIEPTYDIALNYHHSPLIFYAPRLLDKAEIRQDFALQMDVFPTIMAMLNRSFINNTFGINLLEEQRPFAYFSADDKYGCLNDAYFLIVNNEGDRSLYAYQNKDTRNCITEQPELSREMQRYTEAMIQTAQWMVLEGMTGEEASDF